MTRLCCDGCRVKGVLGADLQQAWQGSCNSAPFTMVEPVTVNGQKVWIGCSGYVYKHWHGLFYPPDLPQKKWLEYYARYFPTVELNNTFYMLPQAATFEGWRENAPDGFLYA